MMFPWMKRGIVISSALLTLGMFVPVDFVREAHADEPQRALDENNDNPLIYKVDQDNYDLFHEVLPAKAEHYIHRDITSADVLQQYFVRQAYEQSLNKFGTAISQRISKPFEEEILPRLTTGLIDTAKTFSEEDWKHVKLSVQPASGLGEKIVHLYNDESGADYFRFHVRRDQPPKQGYFFNFHYHTYLDQYERHHELGTIYWGKDMPPQWNGEDRV